MLEGLVNAAADSDPVAFWIWIVVLGAMSVAAAQWGLGAFWQLRLIVDTPTARVRSAPQGYVELQGLAQPQRELIGGRLTGKPCVWFRYRVQQYRSNGKSGQWVTVDSGDAGRPFILDDGTGRCLVEPEGAQLKCRSTETWYGAHAGAAPGRSQPGLFAHSRRFRMTEERVLDREPVYVLGHFETPRRGPRERQALTRTLLAGWKRDPERMRALDSNGDGEVDPQEWEAARASAERIAARAEARLAAEPPLPRIVRTADRRQPFVISTESEDALLSRLRWSAVGGTAIGTALGIGVVFALLTKAVT